MSRIIAIILLILFVIPSLGYALKVDIANQEGNDFICYCCSKGEVSKDSSDNKGMELCYRGNCCNRTHGDFTGIAATDPALITVSYSIACCMDFNSIHSSNFIHIKEISSSIEKPPC